MAQQVLLRVAQGQTAVRLLLGAALLGIASLGLGAPIPDDPAASANAAGQPLTKTKPDQDARATANLLEAKAPPNVDTLHFTVQCVQLVETARFPTLAASGAFATPASHPALSCPTTAGPPGLVGKGQVIVLVDATEYDEVVKSAAAQNLKDTDGPALVLNGFNLGKGAKLVAVERSDIKDPKDAKQVSHFAALRYQLLPDDDSADAWATLYQEVGLLRTAELRVALAWKGLTVFAANPAAKKLTIAISDCWSLALAFGISLVMLAFYFWAMARTDLFRSSQAYPWWVAAKMLRKEVIKALRKHKSAQTIGIVKEGDSSQKKKLARFLEDLRPSVGASDEAQVRLPPEEAGTLPMHEGAAVGGDQMKPVLCPTVLDLFQNSAFGGTSFTNDQVPACLAAAKAALEGNYPDTPEKVNLTVIGLALHRKPIRVARAAFSLISVQVGTWVTFACVAAVFLWLVFGQFPVLKGSMLALVTISALTAATSWLVDPTSKKFEPSVNFLVDLTTGTDGDQRVHRFQAVLVNALLLFIGIAFVVQYLAYPAFDNSWLEFLGLSGFLQTAGKGLLEKQGF